MSFLSKIFSIGQSAVRSHLQSEKVQKMKDRADLEAQILRDKRSNSPFTYFHERELASTDRDIGNIESQIFQNDPPGLLDPTDTSHGYGSSSDNSSPYPW